MKTEDKEKLISEIRLKEVESTDKDISTTNLKMITAWAIVSFSYLQLIIYIIIKDITLESTKLWLLAYIGLILLGSVIVIFYIGKKYEYFVLDCYEWLVDTLKKDKILTEPFLKPPKNIYTYKKRY